MQKIFVLITIFYFGVTKAQNHKGFTYYDTNPKGEKFYYKIESSTDSYVELWILNDKLKTQLDKKTKKSINVNFGSQIVLTKIYCSTKTYDLLDTVVYDVEGNPQINTSQNLFSQKIFPNSAMEGLLKLVCE